MSTTPPTFLSGRSLAAVAQVDHHVITKQVARGELVPAAFLAFGLNRAPMAIFSQDSALTVAANVRLRPSRAPIAKIL